MKTPHNSHSWSVARVNLKIRPAGDSPSDLGSHHPEAASTANYNWHTLWI